MKKPPSKLEVEFASQQGFKYGFWPSLLGNEGTPPLELAYAITVHKSEDEFGTTFVVIPNPSRLLSKELLYTALTRQQRRVVLLYQGDVLELGLRRSEPVGDGDAPYESFPCAKPRPREG